MRLSRVASVVTCLVLLPTGLPAAAQAADLQPRARSAGTPAQILRTVPAAAPLRVGYKRGSFPVQNPVAKDKRGCTLRNQLLIKTAIKRPKIGKGCRLTGGMWSLDFGARTETNPAKVRVTRLVPDVYVYGQGGYMWTPQQRAAYSTYVAPTVTTRAGYRADSNAITPSSWAVTSLSGDGYVKKIYNTLVRTSDPTSAELDALKKQNPVLFQGWTLSTLLNAKSWGISLSPTVYANFSVTINECSTDPEKNNPCATTYSVPDTSAENKVPPLPAAVNEISAVAPVVPEIVQGYNQPAYGDRTNRALFGIHAPAHWNYDEIDKVDGPVDPATIPTVPYGYVRLWDTETTWRDIEPTKGNFVWRKLEKQIQVAQQKDAHVMLVLGGTPGWANGGGGPQNPPTSIDDWSRYVCEVAKHFGGSIAAYEVWNEANLTTFWTGSAAQMADLTKAAFDAIRGCAGSGALVVAANTTSRADGSFGTFFPTYLQELKARGWPVNAYSVHSYPKAAGGNGARIAGISQFRTMLALAGAPFTTVFDTEVNYGMAGLGAGKEAIVGEEAGALLSRTYIDSVRYGFGSTFWYVWTPAEDPKMGIQLTPGATSEQQAWNKTYDWLVGAQFHACGEVPQPQGLVVCQFDRNGEPFSLAWFGEVRTGAATTVPNGFFGALGSKCDTLYSQDCSAILRGEAPLTSTPVRIYGDRVIAQDVPTRLVIRPQPVTVKVGRGTVISIAVSDAAGKALGGQKLNLKTLGAISLVFNAQEAQVETAANGTIEIEVFDRRGSQGDGAIEIQSIGNPNLKTTVPITVDRSPAAAQPSRILISEFVKSGPRGKVTIAGRFKGRQAGDRAVILRKMNGEEFIFLSVDLDPTGAFRESFVQRSGDYVLRIVSKDGKVLEEKQLERLEVSSSMRAVGR